MKQPQKKKLKLKVNRNIRDFVDYDYLKDLTQEQLEFMEKFTDEFYCNGHSKEGSLHSELPEYESKLKKQEFDNTNARNRDAFGFCKNTGRLNSYLDEDYPPNKQKKKKLEE